MKIKYFKLLYFFRLLIIILLFFVGNLFVFNTEVLANKITQEQLTQVNQLWETSSHALNNINCSSCHQNSETKELILKPDQESCKSCHKVTVETFLLGKHGIRIREGLKPLTPSIASLPMKKDAFNKQMNCNTCHNVHSVNTFEASVDSCLTCHNDEHSLNYEKSKHYQLFLEEGTLPRPSIESVTCATCHLPRMDFEGAIHVNHNNTYNLLPRDRMVKDVCMNCHGIEYSYNSIFDDELVTQNFAKPPTLKLKTLDMVHVLKEKRSGN